MPPSKSGQSALSQPTAGILRAIVAFEDREECGRLRLLRCGFRHCFCLVGAGSTWTLCDPLLSRIALMQVNGLTEAELLRELEALGATVLRGEVPSGAHPVPIRLRPLSCVEIVKRILNLDLPWVLTPHQLHQALLRLRPHSRAFNRYHPQTQGIDITL